MIEVLDQPESETSEEGVDRPAWIPFEIVADWDSDPYAYQTEEELMSHGKLHDLLLTYLGQVMPNHLAKFDLELWKDLFLLYRDARGIKRRIGPDMMLAVKGQEFEAEAWDLDKMPVPELLGEITSRRSRKQDFDFKRELYHKLGVACYMVIDGHDKKGAVTGEISVRFWENNVERLPGDNGFLDIPELHIKVKPLDDELVFYHRDSLEPLLDIKLAEEQIHSLSDQNADLSQRIRELEEKLKQSGNE